MYRIILPLLLGISSLFSIPTVFPKDVTVYPKSAELEPIDATVYPIKEDGVVVALQQENRNDRVQASNSLEESGGGVLGYFLPIFALFILWYRREV